MPIRLARVLLVVAALAAPIPAAAQDMPTVLPQGFELNSILNQQRVDAAINSGRSSAPARPTQKVAPVSTAYAPSPAVSQRVRKQFVEWVGRQSGPEAGRKVGEALNTGDPVKSWAGIVGGDGLRAGDFADALAGYWVLNWNMANGADNNRAQAQGALRQVRGLIADNPAYARLNPVQRQEMAETLILNFLLQHAAYVDAMQRGDKDLMRRLGDAANARFRNEMGVNLRQLNLTPAGFVRRA